MQIICLVAVAFLIPHIGTVVHELAHALTARRFGARVGHVIIGASGRVLRFRIAGVSVHYRLGYQRNPQAVKAGGWTAIEMDDLDADQAMRVLRAGPLVESIYGVVALLLILVLRPIDMSTTALWSFAAFTCAYSGPFNLRPNGPLVSDGARIASIRAWQTLIRSGVAAPRPTTEQFTPPVAR